MDGTAEDGGGALSARRRWAVLAICASALFLVGLDTTIVTVALPAIGDGLGVAEERLAWVVDAYTVVFASLLITAGALADRFGRRRVLRIGLAVVALASAACALAPTPGLLLAARALQGVGAAMLSPVALAIVVHVMTDPRERALAIGVWSSVFGLSMAVGPVTGGALLAAFGWRAVFWVGVPVALTALVLVTLLVPESRGRRAPRLDPLGQMLLVLLLALLVGLLIEGPGLGASSPFVLGGLAALAVLALGFVRVQSRRRDPLIAPGLFRQRRFTAAVLGAVAVFIAFSMTLLMSTVHLQDAHGWSPLAAGAATLPMALAATACAPLSGLLLGRAGPRAPLVLAGGALTVGGLMLLGATASARPTWLLPAFLVVGIGVGFANAPLTHTAVGALPGERTGVAGGIASTGRQLGTAIGIALAGGLLAGHGPGGADGTVVGWLVVAACGLAVVLVAGGAADGRAGADGATPRTAVDRDAAAADGTTAAGDAAAADGTTAAGDAAAADGTTVVDGAGPHGTSRRRGAGTGR
jgi:EmrB/QacA subfamily drug resistance transporter